MVQRFKFLDIFHMNPDGSLSPKRVINVNGIVFGPGVSFNAGVSFGGVDFHNYKFLDIAAEEASGVLVIKGFYKDQSNGH